MDISDELKSTFVKADNLIGVLRGVIADVREGRFGKDMELQDGNVLGLNGGNKRILANAWGTETDDWIGKEVELYVGKVMYQGMEKDSVMVRTISPPTARGLTAAKRKAEMDDDIPF